MKQKKAAKENCHAIKSRTKEQLLTVTNREMEYLTEQTTDEKNKKNKKHTNLIKRNKK